MGDKVPPAGELVKVTREFDLCDEHCSVSTEGRVVEWRTVRTDYSFARVPDNRYSFQALVIEKADGERSLIALDEHTTVERLGGTS